MSAAVQVGVKGIGASNGVATGPIFVAGGTSGTVGEVKDFAAAAEAAASRLEGVARSLPGSGAESAAILRAQEAMVRDPALAAAVRGLQEAGHSLPVAIAEAAHEYADRLASLEDPYLRERAADVREAARLLVAEVMGTSASRLSELRRPSIVIAHELSPADTLSVPNGLLLGFVTEVGGLTSHAAIVARELGIPAVVNAEGAVSAAAGHAAAEIDGTAGEVTFIETSEERAADTAKPRLDLHAAPVDLMANIGSVHAAHAAARRGASGVGLFRTEFMFMAEDGPMSEDEQLAVYMAVCDAMSPHPVVVRTLDAGADKPLRYLPAAQEANPQLGHRGVRLWLAHEELWRPQVRALLRAAKARRNLKVMLPMVAARREMLAARELFNSEAKALGADVPDIGMMVEVPAVAAALNAFDGVADFISLGTNDLTQYTVAADRGIDWEEDLGELNPGVLRLIAKVAADARLMGIPAGVCGELAGRPHGAVFLVGVGVTSLSMTADAMPAVLEATARLGRAGCERAAIRALAARDARTASAVLLSALAQA